MADWGKKPAPGATAPTAPLTNNEPPVVVGDGKSSTVPNEINERQHEGAKAAAEAARESRAGSGKAPFKPVVSEPFAPHGGHPNNKAPTRKYKLLRGSYTRKEYPNGMENKGVHVLYAADVPGIPSIVELTEREAHSLPQWPSYLAEVSSGGIVQMRPEQEKYLAALDNAKKGKREAKAKGE